MVVEVAGDYGLNTGLPAGRRSTGLTGRSCGPVGDCGLGRDENELPQTVGAVGRATYRGPVPGVEYRFELRRGEEVVATGHLTREQPLEVGEHLAIVGREGIVRSVEPLLGERELRLVVQLTRREI